MLGFLTVPRRSIEADSAIFLGSLVELKPRGLRTAARLCGVQGREQRAESTDR